MGRRRAANDPSVRVELSERQRQVLHLIARGATNGEIAERLGITLDGAKWHVREILARLDVSSREEAADWWRSRRTGVRLPSWVPRLSWPVGGAAVAAGGLAAVAVVVAVNLGSSTPDEGEAVTAAETATPPAELSLPVVRMIPQVPQPPLREVDSGSGWRLLVADDSKPVPSADRAVIAIRWDLEVPYLDVLDDDGRRAMRVEVGYRPMARLDPNANTLVVSDWANIEEEGRYARVLVFDLAGPEYRDEIALPYVRVNTTVFVNRITLSAGGRWLYWVEHSHQEDPPSCARGGDAAVCDRMIVRAVDLLAMEPTDFEAAMPRACGSPTMSQHGDSAVLAHCPQGGIRFVLDAELFGQANNAILEVPVSAQQDAWDMRVAGGSDIALRVGIESDGSITRITVIDLATGEHRRSFAVFDVWEVHLLDDSTALILRPTGRLERMHLATGNSAELPYAIDAGNQGLDIALVR